MALKTDFLNECKNSNIKPRTEILKMSKVADASF